MAGAAAPASASGLHFSKMHGAGNDFVVLDLRDNPPLAARLTENAPGLCRALADRRTGIGCDQILTIEPPRDAGSMASYRVWNADGSASQQCGNGARCVAAWLVRAGAHGELVEPQPGDERASANRFFLDSPAGTHAVEQRGADRFEVEMGAPEFSPQAIPLTGFTDAQDAYAIDIAGEPIRFGAVSMGNPHAVIEVVDVERAPVVALAPQLQRDATFPQSVNVGFAEVVARDRIRLRVYERGVGETLACGSGACAAVAVLTRQGRVDGDRGVTVSLPGGELHIHYDSGNDGRVRMTGPAAFVYEGDWIS